MSMASTIIGTILAGKSATNFRPVRRVSVPHSSRRRVVGEGVAWFLFAVVMLWGFAAQVSAEDQAVPLRTWKTVMDLSAAE